MIVLHKEKWGLPSIEDVEGIEVFMNINDYLLHKGTNANQEAFIIKNIGIDRPFIWEADNEMFIPYLNDVSLAKLEISETFRKGAEHQFLDLTSSSFGEAIYYGGDLDEEDSYQYDYNQDEYIDEDDYIEKEKQKMDKNNEFYPKRIEIKDKTDREIECDKIIETVEESKKIREAKNDPFNDKKSRLFGGIFNR